MKKSIPTQPTTFRERLTWHEHQRHFARLAEIKKMEANLLAFEPTAAALEANGIRVSCEFPLDSGAGGLRLTIPGTVDKSHRLYDALIDLGFVETDRGTTGSFVFCTLKAGRQKIQLLIEAGHQYAPKEAALPHGRPCAIVPVPAAGANHVN